MSCGYNLGPHKSRFLNTTWSPSQCSDDAQQIVTVQDFLDIASSLTHIVHADGLGSGDPHFKYDFSEGVSVF